MTGISGQAREEAERRAEALWPFADPALRAIGQRRALQQLAYMRGFEDCVEWAASLNPEPSPRPDLDAMEELLSQYQEDAFPAHADLFALIAEVRAAREVGKK